MTWSRIEAVYGGILRGEARRRCRGNNANLSWDDCYQTASFAAWQYCRDRAEKDVDARILRVKVRSALYDLAVRSHGIHIPRPLYTEWASRKLSCAVRSVSSLEGLVELDGDAAFSSLFDDGRPRRDDTACLVAEFVSSLPQDEREVLTECLRTGLHSDQSLSRSLRRSRTYVHKAMRRLRMRCEEFFDCHDVA